MNLSRLTKTVKQLKEEILVQRFPSGSPENLVLPVEEGVASPMDLLFQEAFAEIAKWVECERSSNVDVIPFCRTWFKCGMTAVPAPRGIIRRLFTIVRNASDEWCDPVFYTQSDYQVVECMARNRLYPASPNNTGKPRLPLGFQQANADTDLIPDTDPATRWQRARTGVWAIYDGKIWVGPWLQSNEVLVIDWKGIKTEWRDEDLINPDQDYKKAVKLYIDFGYERDWGDMQRAREFYQPGNGRMSSGYFAEALADLMWECRERTRTRPTNGCGEERNRLLAELLDDAPVEASPGDSGEPPGDGDDEPPPEEPDIPYSCGGVASAVADVSWTEQVLSGSGVISHVGATLTFSLGAEGGTSQWDGQLCNPLSSGKCLKLTATVSWDAFPPSAVPFSQIGLPVTGGTAIQLVSVGQGGTGSAGATNQQFIGYVTLPAETITHIFITPQQGVADGSPNFRGTILLEIVDCP